MLIDRDKSALILVDVQEKLTPHVIKPDKLVEGCSWLLRLAGELSIPCLVSEQYPQGLKSTVKALKNINPDNPVISKVSFSCASEPSFMDAWHKLEKSQAILMGIETHVCMLQTALELKQKNVDVFVVVDATSSRHEIDHQTGLERLREEGIRLVTREMVFFEWIRKAGTPEFKNLSQDFLR